MEPMNIDRGWYRDARTRLCRFKRFLERWEADESFRRWLKAEPEDALAQYHLEVDIHEARVCSELDLIQAISSSNVDDANFPESLREFRRLEQYRRRTRHYARQHWIPANPRFRTWRERQLARVYIELGRSAADELDFGTANYELADGCSVGCWFCGLSAPRLAGLFLHTKENAQLWRDVLEVMVEICGPLSVRSHIMYWATDPFDNPDYEEFWLDFHNMVGVLPHTTTALPLKDPERTRAFLDLRRCHGGFMDRFSILSVKILNRVHEVFTADQMSHIQCSFPNRGAIFPKVNAGRFRDQGLIRPAVIQHEFEKFPSPPAGNKFDATELLGATICCQAGFSLNMVRRQVKLISPCRANHRWRDGTIIHGQASFRDAKELRKVILKLIDDQMPTFVPPRHRVQFSRDLRYEPLVNGFQLSNVLRRRVTYTHDSLASYFTEVGKMIRSGRYTTQEIGERLLRRHAVFPDDTTEFLNQLFRQGMLSEEPAPEGPLEPPEELSTD